MSEAVNWIRIWSKKNLKIKHENLPKIYPTLVNKKLSPLYPTIFVRMYLSMYYLERRLQITDRWIYPHKSCRICSWKLFSIFCGLRIWNRYNVPYNLIREWVPRWEPRGCCYATSHGWSVGPPQTLQALHVIFFSSARDRLTLGFWSSETARSYNETPSLPVIETWVKRMRWIQPISLKTQF